jgi:hypothetical protein
MKIQKLLAITFFLITTNILLAQKQSPFYDYGSVDGDIKSVTETIKTKLSEQNFIYKGGYHVAGNKDKYVIVFSRKDLLSTCLKTKKEALLAAGLRIGLAKKDGKINITSINPNYMFLGYFQKDYAKSKSQITKINKDFTTALKGVGNKFSTFGGSIDSEDLLDYHYMIGMPYFEDMVELKEFNNFDEAYNTILKNLKAKKANTEMIYKFNYKSLKTAVFGIAQHNKETGEPHFLPIVGDKHIAAMPYEILIIENKAFILHGRFRFAFYWPDLSMSTFSKIMSTPGDVEDTMKELTK